MTYLYAYSNHTHSELSQKYIYTTAMLLVTLILSQDVISILSGPQVHHYYIHSREYH